MTLPATVTSPLLYRNHHQDYSTLSTHLFRADLCGAADSCLSIPMESSDSCSATAQVCPACGGSLTTTSYNSNSVGFRRLPPENVRATAYRSC